MSWILIAIAGAGIQLVVAEIFDWFPWVSAKIIRFAAASLPDRFGARWEAEWLAELDAVPGKSISKVLFALSVLRGVPRLRMTLDPSAPRIRSLVGARSCDVAFAATALLLLLPIFLAVAVVIRVSIGQGPIFFRSLRVGPDGETFVLFKFRTNAVRRSSTQVVDPDRPLLTFAFLRRTGLDELPRLINVLRGEMSIVGPPPAFPWDSESDLVEHSKAGVVSWSVVIADPEEARRRDLAYQVSWSPAKFFEAMRMAILETLRGSSLSGRR
jgi:lipopolysaccharide/colanic/teichoic acid biosynthesis glycosyltransferase